MVSCGHTADAQLTAPHITLPLLLPPSQATHAAMHAHAGTSPTPTSSSYCCWTTSRPSRTSSCRRWAWVGGVWCPLHDPRSPPKQHTATQTEAPTHTLTLMNATPPQINPLAGVPAAACAVCGHRLQPLPHAGHAHPLAALRGAARGHHRLIPQAARQQLRGLPVVKPAADAHLHTVADFATCASGTHARTRAYAYACRHACMAEAAVARMSAGVGMCCGSWRMLAEAEAEAVVWCVAI